MRGIVACVLLFVALVTAANADDNLALTLPSKCEDVLPAKYCDQLRQVAARVHAKASEVEQAVTLAVTNGAQTASDIYNKSLDFFKTRVQTLTCADVLSAERCNRLQIAAKLIHAKANEVNEAVRHAVLKGVQSSKDLYANAVDFFKNRMQTLTCADVLPTEKCAHLQNIATVVKAKTGEVSVSVQLAVLKAFESAQDVYASAVDFFKNRVHKLTCADLLSSDQCSKLTVIAGNLKSKFSEGEEKLRAAILSGKAKATELYETTVAFFKEKVANKKCEDLLATTQCDQLRSLSKNLHLKTSEFRAHVINALTTGVQTTKDTFETVKDYLKTKVTCETMFSNKTCSSIRNLAARLKLTVSEVDRIVREAIVNGIKTASDLYKKVLDYLSAKILGNSDQSRLRRSILPDSIKNAILEKIAKAKEMMRAAVRQCLDAFQIADAKVRGIIEQAILDGKVRVSKIKETIKSILDKMVAGNIAASDDSTGAALARHRRDLREELKAAVLRVRGVLKLVIQQLLNQSNDALLKVRNYIESILAKVNGGRVTRDVANEFDDLQSTVDEVVKSQLNELVNDAESKAEKLITEAAEASEADLDVITASLTHSISRRDLFTDLMRLKVEILLGLIDGIFGSSAKSTAKKLIEDNKVEIEAAYRAGTAALYQLLLKLIPLAG